MSMGHVHYRLSMLLVTCVLIPPLGRRSLSAFTAGRSGVQDPSSVDVQINSSLVYYTCYV